MVIIGTMLDGIMKNGVFIMDEVDIYCPHCGKVASIFLFDLIVLLGVDGEEHEMRFACTYCGAEWSEILEVTKLMENL